MCLSRAYVARNGERGLFMEDVASVEVKDDKLLLKTLFGEEKEIEANIRKIDFVARSIILEELKGKI